MKRRWNLSLFAGFLLALAAFLSYFLYFAYFPATRDVPWVNLLLFVVALGLLGRGLVRAYKQPESYRGRISGPLLSTLGVALLGLFLFYNFSFSRQLPRSEKAPGVGQPASDFTLPDKNDEPVTLSQLYGGADDRWVLLVFYRGYW